jgi:hypothetical protein
MRWGGVTGSLAAPKALSNGYSNFRHLSEERTASSQALKQDTIALERDSRSARGQAAAGNGINRRLAGLVT